MRAGELDRQIRILAPVVTIDTVGDEVEVWSVIMSVWASKHEIGAAELIRNPQVKAEMEAIFTIRTPEQPIDPSMRVEDDAGRLYEIAGITELPGRRVGLEIRGRHLERSTVPMA
jgi:head-tail adaptor